MLDAASYTPRLKAQYKDTIRATLKEEFGYKNDMMIPRLDKIVLNIGAGAESVKDSKKAKSAVEDLTAIAGQKALTTRASKSIAGFRVREEMPLGTKVTLRGDRMWDFLDRFINLATPRIKDFRGLSDTSFDRAGNYSIGLTEQGVFPELNMANVTFTHGMNINFVFRNSDKAKSRTVLEALGMPFRKPPAPKKKAS